MCNTIIMEATPGNNDNNKRRPSSTAVDDQAYFQLLYEDAGKS